MSPVSEVGTLIKSSLSVNPSVPCINPSSTDNLPPVDVLRTGITIKLQRFHGFTPAAIKNTAKSIVPDELNVIWNNAFRCIVNCRWRESVKPLQFYCNTVSCASSKNDIKDALMRTFISSVAAYL